MATPNWSAARSGLLGDTGAVNASNQVNQLLGTHGITALYRGNQIITPFGTGGINGQHILNKVDYSQPFVLSGTSVGRVVIPVTPCGTGADLVVSLCADSAGVPGALITQTKIPAQWVYQLSAVAGISGAPSVPPVMQYTGNPLAVAQFNNFHLGVTGQHSWPYPTAGSGGPSVAPCSCYYGNYFIQMGGGSGAARFDNVFTIMFDGAGNVSPAVPQQGLPMPTDGTSSAVAVTESSGAVSIVLAGGSTSPGVLTDAVYTSTFDPSTGNTSAWTTQASLPGTNQYSSMATYNGYVYVVSGFNGTFPVNGVYYAQVQNGQITAWTAGPTLPTFYTGGLASGYIYSAASNGFLFVFGGNNGVNLNVCAYAPINANGSLGNWIQGPNIPVAVGVINGNPAIVASTYGIIANGGAQLFSLGVGPNGPDISWQGSDFPSGGNYFAGVETADGYFQYYGLFTVGAYETAPVALQPRISVPLPVTGLTNGATYHVVMQQASYSDLNNYLVLPDDREPGHLSALHRDAGTITWTPQTPGAFVPIEVFDKSAVGKLWHLYDDGGARISTFAWGTTPNQPLLGILEATAQPGPVLNQYYNFTSGLGPWHATGAAAVQSNAFTHGNLPFSARVTPTGTDTLSYIESELVAVVQQHQYLASAWLYSPTGYGNIAVSINWFDSTRAYISTTAGTSTAIAAGVWTFLQTPGTPPTNAVFMDVVPIEGGTPAASAVFYVSTATAQDASGPMVSSAVQFVYNGTWPSAGEWPPVEVVSLA